MVKVVTSEIVARAGIEIVPLLVKVVIPEIAVMFVASKVPSLVMVVILEIVVRFAAVIVPELVIVLKLESVVLGIVKVPLFSKVIPVLAVVKVVAAVNEPLPGITYLV